MSISAATPVSTPRRAHLDDLDLPQGKRARLHTLLYEHGPANGTLLMLPLDQGLEHGPVDFFVNPPAADPEFQVRLALDGNYSGIALQIGLAKRYLHRWAGRLPLVLKVNGRTNPPASMRPFHQLTSSVEDAVRLGSCRGRLHLLCRLPRPRPRPAADERGPPGVRPLRHAAHPLLVVPTPGVLRSPRRGARTASTPSTYAARVAAEMGADARSSFNIPREHSEADAASPAPYDTLVEDRRQMLTRIIRSAGRSLVIFAGGSKLADDELIGRIDDCMAAGATGFIFGRNMWQRPMAEAITMTGRVHELLQRYGHRA